MKRNYKMFFQIIITLLIFGGCSDSIGQSKTAQSKEFDAYWYRGEAELSRYRLNQARYGEIHSGDAVLIYVTEDFRSDSQVKYEGGDRKNVVPILKLNHTKKFNTGLYPYSMMTSIFSPIDGSPTLKVSTSAQEWCGHSFTQLNYDNNKYKGHQFSYFQSEGDATFKVKPDVLEDHLWTMIRLDPASLPLGEISILPGTQFIRLKHLNFKERNAKASLSEVSIDSLSSDKLLKYKVEYQDADRSLSFIFEKEFPYTIVQWTETNKSGFGSKVQVLTTTATLTHQIKSPYWSKNGVLDSPLRKQLGLK